MMMQSNNRCPWLPACRMGAAVGLAIGLLLSPAVRANDVPVQRVSFYFAAHEDDWQLFMNPSAFHDVGDAETKTVFIHLTAGDAGVGVGTRDRKHPYYLARENGAEEAIRFMADAGEQPVEKVVSRASMWRTTATTGASAARRARRL